MAMACFAGCKEEPGKKERKEEIGQNVTICESNYCIGEDGVLVLENGGLVAFYDYQIEEYLPFCSKPNCKHQTEECGAVALAAGTDWIGYHKGAVYYCDSRSGTKLYTADLDGENVKQLGTYDHQMSWGKKIFYDGHVYLVTNNNRFEEDGSYQGVQTELLEIDLENGEARTLIEAREYTRPGYDLLGIFEGKLYYVDRIDSNCLMELNLQTGETEKLKKDVYNAKLEKGNLVYCVAENQGMSVYERGLAERSEQFLSKGTAYIDIWDDRTKIVSFDDEERSGFYQWKEDDFYYISPFKNENEFLILTRYGEYFLGMYRQKFSRVLVSDYLDGEFEPERLEITEYLKARETLFA